MSLYTKEQLNYERSRGLIMSDKENESWYDDDNDEINTKTNIETWSDKEFELWLNTKNWSEEIKNVHRQNFKGVIGFTSYGTIKY